MCAAPAVAIASKPTTSADALVSAVTAIVSGFHAKTLHLIKQRPEIEAGSDSMRGYIESVMADELPADTQLEALSAKVSEKSMHKFRGEIAGLQAKLAEAKDNLFLAQFCFRLFDQFADFDLIFDQFNKTLAEVDALKENPFGLGDHPRRLGLHIIRLSEHLTTAKSQAIAHRIILSEDQSESLEHGVALLNKMKKEITSREFLRTSFAGVDLTLSACNTFYHNLPILYLQRKCREAESMSGGKLDESLDQIARMIADLDPVLRVKIHDKRPIVEKEAILVSSLILEEAEIERTELYNKAEIHSYKIGLERALIELPEYTPRRTKQSFEAAGGAGSL